MKVPDISLFFITSISLISILTPLVFYTVVRQKLSLSLKVIIIGGIFWLLFAQIFENGLHIPLVAFTDIEQYPFVFALISAGITSILQEGGRYIAFTKLLKNYHKLSDGIAYGIGHGGISTIFIGIGMSMQLLYYARLLNTGNFFSLEDQLPYATYSNLVNTLTGPYFLFLLMGIERLCMFFIQVALSLIVLIGIRKKKWWFFLLAVLIHTIVLVPEMLFEEQQLNMILVVIYLSVLALGSFFFLRYAEKVFTE